MLMKDKINAVHSVSSGHLSINDARTFSLVIHGMSPESKG